MKEEQLQVFRLEIHEVRHESANLFSVAYATSVEPLVTYQEFSKKTAANGVLEHSDISIVKASQALTAALLSSKGFLIFDQRHDGDLGTISPLQEVNIEGANWYKNSREEIASHTPQFTTEMEMSNETNKSAAKSTAEEAKIISETPAQETPTVMSRVKSAATSPTAKTIGWALGTIAMGFLGGMAASEVRKRKDAKAALAAADASAQLDAMPAESGMQPQM
ncbi:MAG TPA: hypothetical protein VFM18_21145 [Methanosarcina sp.]|nr:hypothetical protein [Methanosarcina sp.]